MDNPSLIQVGQILSGSLFSERMRVITVRSNGHEAWDVGVVGIQSNIFRSVTLTQQQIKDLNIIDDKVTYDGDSQLLRLGIQAYALGIAYEFDPYFGLSVSRVDPLPHQLEAVYDYLLKLPCVRFLLADDAGAGKTIMAGLLVRELKLRGLLPKNRILIVCPSNLTFQWQRELKEKFDEKFVIMKGGDIRDQFGMNQWLDQNQIITSLDLAKRSEILPGLQQVRWDFVIVDEAHRMSASDPEHKTLRYRLGELLRDTTDHILLLTATPHKGDPENFSFFLQLLDKDAYADVRSIRQAIERRRAPFYLRRTKEAMVYFPERQLDGKWIVRKIFTKRIPTTVDFQIDGEELELYRQVTRFVKRMSAKAAASGEDLRARAVGFLMSLYQRRMASSTYAMRHSLDNRARRLEDALKHAQELARSAPPDLPDSEELEEMEEGEREKLESILEAITLAGTAEQVQEEIKELRFYAEQAKAIEESSAEAKLSRLKEILQQEGFFDHADKRLLIFTEFRDTLDYLMKKLKDWGFSVGCIHGQMKSGSRNDPNTRLYSEQQFRDGAIQVLVATEAAGEGINLQCCNILFNYDIPWNPNRLEQRMGRIHRYGQTKECLIFNFVATNTIEGQILKKLLERLQEIRDALDDDAVFNVIGEILPAAHVDRVLREYYAGRFGESDLEERILRDVNEEKFRAICQNALEGLAAKKLNLEMLVERRALAQEKRVVPETIARFIKESVGYLNWNVKPIASLPHVFEPTATPSALRQFELDPTWKLQPLAHKYPKISTDRKTAEANNLEWVTPGHPLFEALRRYIFNLAQPTFSKGGLYYSLSHSEPTRMDFYRARIVDGLGQTIHERLFVMQITAGQEPKLCDPAVLGNLQVTSQAKSLPGIESQSDWAVWLNKNALEPFLDEVSRERLKEVERIKEHIEISLTELIQKADQQIGKFADAEERGDEGAKGLLVQAETKQQELIQHRDRRRQELKQQATLSLQSVERVTSIYVLPHPERERLEVKRLQPDYEVEATAMRMAIEYEQSAGRHVSDVHEKNLGYDLTSLDASSGELRLIEVKGIGAATGTVLLTPNEKRVAEDRRDCYWLYVATNCKETPILQDPIKDPVRLPWYEVKKVQHYYLNIESCKK